MFFIPCSIHRQRNPLALVPKKSIALQSRWQPSAGVVPILGGSSASVTMSPTDQDLPMVAPVPLMGQADAGVQGAPSEVTEQPMMAVIPWLTVGQTGLPTVLVTPIVVGAT